MRTIKLGELVTFIPGLNPTRAEKQSQDKERIYYDHSSFEVDYYHRYESIAPIRKATVENDLALNEGDIVMSNSLQLAAMVSKENVGKVLSLNSKTKRTRITRKRCYSKNTVEGLRANGNTGCSDGRANKNRCHLCRGIKAAKQYK